MDIVSILGFFDKIGTIPALIIIGIILGFFVKELRENGKRDEARGQELKSFFIEEMTILQKSNEESHRQTNEALDELSRRISAVEKDYVPREEHYREFSGWRTEINRVADRLDRVIERLPAPGMKA